MSACPRLFPCLGPTTPKTVCKFVAEGKVTNTCAGVVKVRTQVSSQVDTASPRVHISVKIPKISCLEFGVQQPFNL